MLSYRYFDEALKIIFSEGETPKCYAEHGKLWATMHDIIIKFEKEIRDNLLNLDVKSQVFYLEYMIDRLYPDYHLATPKQAEEYIDIYKISIDNIDKIPYASQNPDDLAYREMYVSLVDEYQQIIEFHQKAYPDHLPFLSLVDEDLYSSFSDNEIGWYALLERDNSKASIIYIIAKECQKRGVMIPSRWPDAVKERLNILDDKLEDAQHTPAIKWKGSGVELLDLFVALDEQGYITLPNPKELSGPSWETICKSICRLFDISDIRRGSSTGEDWKTLAAYFKGRTLDKVTGELTYDRLGTNVRRFDTIKPPKPPRTGRK